MARRIDLVGNKELYDSLFFDMPPAFLSAYLRDTVGWNFMEDNIRLITIKANHDLIIKERLFELDLYDHKIIEPNTDYNCIKIGKMLLLMVRKDSIQGYTNVSIDMVPSEKVIKIKDENITNFVHWTISYDYDAFQCVYQFMHHFLIEAHRFRQGLGFMYYNADNVSRYIIERLKGIQSPAQNRFVEYVKFVGEAMLANSNLKEKYRECLSKNRNKNVLLQKIHSATRDALEDLLSKYRGFCLANISKKILYNHASKMFYRDIEKTEQHYEIYLNTKARGRIRLHSYFITDNSKTIISFLLLILGAPSHIGLPLCVEEQKSDANHIYIEAIPNIKYTIDCEKNEVSAHISEIEIFYKTNEKVLLKKEYVVKKTFGNVVFKGHNYLYLFYFIKKAIIFIKQYYGIRKILLDNNSMMVIPSIRQRVAISILW